MGSGQPGVGGGDRPSAGTVIQFQLLAIAGGALFWCGLALPAVQHGTSLLTGSDAKPRLLLGLVLVPLLIGVVAGPHRRFFAGLAGGVAAWAGAGLVVFWLDAIRRATTGPVELHAKLAAGAYCQIGASAALIMTAVASAAFVPDDEPRSSMAIWAVGAIGAGVVGVGVIIPPVSMPFKDWWQLSEPTAWAGGGFLFFVLVMCIVASVGFRHGAWGLGLVAGFFAEGFIAHNASSGELFSAYAHDLLGYSGVATAGFVLVVLASAAMAVLLGVPGAFAASLPGDDAAGMNGRSQQYAGPEAVPASSLPATAALPYLPPPAGGVPEPVRSSPPPPPPPTAAPWPAPGPLDGG